MPLTTGEPWRDPDLPQPAAHTSNGGGNLRPDAGQIRRWLDILHGQSTGEISICAFPNGTTISRRFIDPDQATRYALSLDRETGVYLGCCTVRPGLQQGRGRAGDMVSFPGMWADLDIGTVGHAAAADGTPNPPDEAAAAQLIDHLPPPTALIHSGGGLYPWWLLNEPITLTDENRAGITELSTRWQQAITDRAGGHGWRYGNVGDLPRVLRIPGGVNRKAGLARPCRIIDDNGPRYTIGEIHAALDSLEPPEQPKTPNRPTPAGDPFRTQQQRTGVGPFDALEEAATFADILPAGWVKVTRQSDGVEEWLRPGEPSSAYSARAYLGGKNLITFFSDAAGLPVRQPMSPGQLFSHLHHGGNMPAAAGDLLKAAAGNPAATAAARGLPASTLAHIAAACNVTPYQAPKAEQAPKTETPPAPDSGTEYELFWSQREWLTTVHSFAKARGAAPWGTLGEVLVQVSTAKHWQIKLPPILGGEVPLNLLVALVGPSGGGKGIAQRTGRAAVKMKGCPPATALPIGSGQAIAHAYMKPAPKKKTDSGDLFDDAPRPAPVQHTWNVIFDVPEISTLGGLIDMNGSQLNGEMCKAFFGETLGGSYVDITKNVPVPEGRYAFGMTMGVQPKKADILLQSEDGGTPQRVLWLSISNPGIPDERPDGDPEPYTWQHPPIYAGPDTPIIVDVCEPARREIYAAHVRRVRAEIDDDIAPDLDGHLLLTRLKVAATFGLLDGRVSVNEEDWHLAGIIMSHSLRVRTVVENVQAKMAAEKNTAAAHATAAKNAVIEDDTAARKVRAAGARILTKLDGRPGWTKRKELRRLVGRTWWPWFDEAMDHHIAAGAVESRTVPGHGRPGAEYRMKP